MNVGLSDWIRSFAKDKYVRPAIRDGRLRFSIRVKDIHNDLKSEGFPPRHTPQICDALTGGKFLRENGLEIERVEGPPSGQSPTVVVHYCVGDSGQAVSIAKTRLKEKEAEATVQEDPTERAIRLTEKLRGILKDELAEYGGGEAFLRWVRSDDEDTA
jgi:hypothetical protein